MIPPKEQKSINDEKPNYNLQYLPQPTNPQSLHLNFENGMSRTCIDKIVQHSELMKSRERVKREQDDGRSLKLKLESAKRVTAGILFRSGSARLGKTVFEIQKEIKAKKDAMEREKIQKAKETYFVAKTRAQNILQGGKPLQKLNIKELRILLAPLKRKDDPPLPTKKSELLAQYELLKERPNLYEEEDAEKRDAACQLMSLVTSV